VLDLGCGGGIDTILAAHRTGPAGRVIALDFRSEMLTRTANAASEAGLSNVEPLEGELKAIPLPDDSVDLVISNGVINLSARKARVMAECARVLKPGGEMCVSDLTAEHDGLPPEILTQPAAWAGCVAGALAEDDFLHKLQRVGFPGAQVLHRQPLSIDDCALYPLFSDDVIALMRKLIPTERQGRPGGGGPCGEVTPASHAVTTRARHEQPWRNQPSPRPGRRTHLPRLQRHHTGHPRVAETTQPYLITHFGNPSSGHAYCRTAPPRAGRGPPTTDRCTRQSQTEVHSDLADSRISLPWTSTPSAIAEMSGSNYELLTFKRSGQLRARTG
jgi:SAM-dependent methyltransferase